MSKREDIIEGKDAANRAYGLVYSCNCGWLDIGHLTPRSPRRFVGAESLWQQLRAEGRDAVAPVYEPRRRGLYHAQFPDGATGFKVTYMQDMWLAPGGVRLLQSKAMRSYLVRHHLPTAVKQKIALAIFMEVSTAFEGMQSSFPYSLATDSGFSQEDLPSNLIGLYIALGLVTKQQAMAECRPTSKTTSLAMWDRYGAVGADRNKNRSFDPVLRPDTSIDDNAERLCRDECAGQPRQPPAFLKRLTPEPKGWNFADLPNW